MSFDRDTLIGLLPAIYRTRDLEHGRPLEALLDVVAEQVAILEEDLAQFYDDQFIETCAEWVVPYIGDLIGYRALHGAAPRVASSRAEVANTIGYRRRKGTASMLEQLARDVTGWPARVVEYFELLGWTQYMQHTRLDPPRGGTLDLRDHDACQRVAWAQGAFDTSAHTVDVRSIASGRGRYGIRNVGIFLWRVQSYSLAAADARKVGTRRYTFNQAGLDAPLFNRPVMEDEITQMAAEANVPHPMPRRRLRDALNAASGASGVGPTRNYFDASRPMVEVTVDGTRLQPTQLQICNLDDWSAPHKAPDDSIRAAIDPVLGRLTFPVGHNPRRVVVSYAYGFSADMGGGPYDRSSSLPSLENITWQIGVATDIAPDAGQIVGTFGEAVTGWNTHVGAATVPVHGVIAILDNHSYEMNVIGNDALVVPGGSSLMIVGADWPLLPPTGASGPRRRVPGQITPVNRRAHLRGDIEIIGVEGTTPDLQIVGPGQLHLNGLLIEGAITVLPGNLGALELTHCTLVPSGDRTLEVRSAAGASTRNDRLALTIDRSITGALLLDAAVPFVQIADSVIANNLVSDDGEVTLEAEGSDVTIERTTVFGRAVVRSISASNCIFTGQVAAARRQIGCVRFSFVPPSSVVPRPYRCQPALEIAASIERATREAAAALSTTELDAIRDAAIQVVQPSFTVTRYGLPGYAQLTPSCARQIRLGADDEGEMGAFHHLHQPQRETNLRERLDEYLRAGLHAGFFYVS